MVAWVRHLCVYVCVRVSVREHMCASKPFLVVLNEARSVILVLLTLEFQSPLPVLIYPTREN